MVEVKAHGVLCEICDERRLPRAVLVRAEHDIAHLQRVALVQHLLRIPLGKAILIGAVSQLRGDLHLLLLARFHAHERFLDAPRKFHVAQHDDERIARGVVIQNLSAQLSAFIQNMDDAACVCLLTHLECSLLP